MSTVWEEEDAEVETPAPAEVTPQPEPSDPAATDNLPQTTPDTEIPTSEEARETESASVDVEIPDEEFIHSTAIDERFSNSPKGARDYIRRLTARLESFGGQRNVDDGQKLIQKYLDPTADLADIDATFHELSPSQRIAYGEYLISEIIKIDPEPIIYRMFGKGVTADQIREALNAPQTEPTDDYQPDDRLSDYELDQLDPLVRAEIEAGRASREELKTLKEKFPQLEEKVNAFTSQQQEAEARQKEERETKLAADREQLENRLYEKVYGRVVPKVLDDLRLKPIEGDSEELKDLKLMAGEAIVTNIDKFFLETEEGKKLVAQIQPFIDRLEESNVFRYEDVLTVQAERALKTLLESKKVAPLLTQINNLARSQSNQLTRERPKELIGGSTPPAKPVDDIVRGKGVDAVWGLDE